ncbi:hypothetical protein SAMN02910275_00700 [Butyrivibrio sp. INlla18]|uniref:hypothetical protein n=1 Tax=Butyrivibrio sp. INlla18 TaxID=1520806 RepID=UPI0008911377|nr:hypothetical protein [Butyrivibrio sp. INlla18]SDA47881.1 hypothetical protein SAMN02910275_00700 [Butyrivibrio sp. INlla18]
MKKILALMVVGVMMFSSTLCVCAEDAAGTGTSTDNNVGGSISISKEEWEKMQKNQEENNKTIAELTKQIQSLTNAVRAGQNNNNNNKSSSGGESRPSSRASANEFYKRNNAVGYGSNTVAQGGHVEINGGKSNVTFVLTPATGGQLTAATTLASNVGGTLLNVVTTSSPGASFTSAKVNFYVSGVVVGDNIAVYQIQNNQWVQLPTAEIRKDHVVVNMTKHGTIAFVRVPVLASVTG